MLLLFLSISLVLLPGCAGLHPPVNGPVGEGFAPIGRYAGHWGIDFRVAEGSAVRAADDGIVTFAGVVVGNRSVTIDHGGVKTSYSYLTRILTKSGAGVARGEVIALSGLHRLESALHFSVRVGGIYVDPEPWLRCLVAPGPGLWLGSTFPAYPVADAGDHGRYLRPTTRGASGGG